MNCYPHHNGVYYLDYKIGKVRYRESTGTKNKKLAERIAAKREMEIIEESKLGITPIKHVLLSDFIETYLIEAEASKVSGSVKTDRKALNALKEIIGDKHLDEIKEEHIEKYKATRLKQDKAPGTVSREMNTIKNMFKKALRRNHIRKDPCRDVKKPQEPPGRIRYLSKDEMAKLLDACRETPYLYLFTIIALNTGMRKNEILNLTWRDIDLENDLIHLEQTKNGERADILMNDVVREEILKYKEQYPDCNMDSDERISPIGDVKKWFWAALDRAGIKNFRIHDLRHTFASYLVMNNVSLVVVKDLMRHKSFEMTLRYAHLAPAQKKDAVVLVGSLMRATEEEARKKKEEGRNQISTSE